MTKSSTNHSILVIDSGVGGLSVCQAILARRPDIHITYYADDAYFPYGLLAEDKLIERLHSIVQGMLAQYQPSLIVFACNTVSTLVLPEFRERYDVSFVGVVPAIKPAAKLSETKHIALLATPATISRSYTDELINDFAVDCDVTRIGSSDLVVQAERRLFGDEVCQANIKEALKPLGSKSKPSIDTLVLGCTHFPFLKADIQNILPSVNLVDSGDAIARRVDDLLSSTDSDVNDLTNSTSHHIHFSKTLPNQTAFSATLSELGISDVEFYLSPFQRL